MTRLAHKAHLPLWLALVALAAPVVAGPVLHERFEPDPVEDLRFGATTPSGTMPASMETRSGMITAPDESWAEQRPDQQAYGGAHTPTSADASYHIDRLTTRPDRVHYDEPFRPSILPFKRLYAFDWLHEDLSFQVAGKDLTRVSVGGSVEHTEDAFFADFNVDIVAGVPVRIPSVGPGARIRAFHVDPPQEAEVLEDSAENWFVRGTQQGRVRMVMQLSIDREVFGSQFRPVTWADLAPFVTPVPRDIVATAREVADHIGVSRTDSPAQAMLTLVDYFRRFHESDDLPTSTTSRELYRELVIEQKGVCRHRAFAFAVTALTLGLPTRIVHNEAHAWVEVFDTEVWHRVDLGGAASTTQQSQPDQEAPNHRPPSDPYSWPQGATSGLSLAQQLPTSEAPQTSDSAGQSSSPGPETDSLQAPDSSSAAQGSFKGAPGAAVFGSEPSAPDMSLRIGENRLLRGRPLAVSGRASRDGKPCRLSRVDIFAEGSEGRVAIGSVATDRQGKFQGHVTLPSTTPVGRLKLIAQVVGGCE